MTKARLFSGASVLGRILLGLYFVVFITEIVRLLFRADWVSVPGGEITIYVVVIFIVVAVQLRSGSFKANWDESLIRIGHNVNLLFIFFTLVLVASIYWVVDSSAGSLLLVDLSKSFFVCMSAICLPSLCSCVERDWRVYLSFSFVIYCLGIWVDALQPGVFTELVGLGNFIAEGKVSGVSGFNLDSNSGSYIVIFLAILLLIYQRFRVIDLVVLSSATLTILLTLSRSGLLIIIVTSIGYSMLIVIRSPKQRLLVASAFGATLIFTVLCGWASIRFIEHFENPKVQIAVDQLLIQNEWFRTRLRSSNEYLIGAHLQELEPFGQVNAPKAPEPTVPSVPKSTVIELVDPTDLEPLKPGVRSYMTFVDGGEYVHIESRRMARLRNALDAIAESPIVGHGIGFDQNAGISAHNMFLALWIDFGLFGFFTYVTLLVVGFWKFYKMKFWPGIFFVGAFSFVSMFIQHVFTLYPAFFLMGVVLSMNSNLRHSCKLAQPSRRDTSGANLKAS